MNLSPFTLPDFTRLAWASNEARDVWAPRLVAIRAAWVDLERWTVADRVRRVALQTVKTETVPVVAASMKARGLLVQPLGQVGKPAAYSATNPPAVPGQPSYSKIAVLHHAESSAWLMAWSAQDHDLLGSLLGYPACCRAHFLNAWIAKHDLEPTWAQAGDQAGHLVTLTDALPSCNVLGRFLDIRAVPHLPCGFRCSATDALADRFAEVALAHGYGAEWRDIAAILSWPTQWSCLHGLAEIITPVWRVVTRTNATIDRYEVRLESDHYPAEGADGVVFPFRPHQAPIDTWTANGFRSPQAMLAAHRVVVDTLDKTGRHPISALDLGCGNGLLVRRLAAVRVGIDLDPARIAEAVKLDPTSEYRVGDVADLAAWQDVRTHLTVLMPGRLVERPSAETVEALCGRRLLLYGYQDWLERYGGLDGLVAAAGLTVDIEARVDRPHAAALVGFVRSAA